VIKGVTVGKQTEDQIAIIYQNHPNLWMFQVAFGSFFWIQNAHLQQFSSDSIFQQEHTSEIQLLGVLEMYQPCQERSHNFWIHSAQAQVPTRHFKIRLMRTTIPMKVIQPTH